MRRNPFLQTALWILWVYAGIPAASAQGKPASGQLEANMPGQISPADINDMIRELSGPQFGGRLTGTPKFRQAAEYIAGHFRKWGVLPAAGKDFLQSWPVACTVIGPRSRFAQIDKGVVLEYKLYDEYMPALFTATGAVEAPAVFVGYGITGPELGYDDYQGVDVKGKILLVIKGMPTPDVGRWGKYDDHAVRMKNARAHGAAGLVYIYMPVAVPKGLWQEGFPVVLVSRNVAEKWFTAAGQDYAAIIKKIADGGLPFSFPTGRTFRIETESTHYPKAEGLNVVAYIEGADPILRREAVVIGAHMDGCGESPELMPGAFDNASGTVTMMCLAKAFAAAKDKPKRSICFVGFGGEEMGKLGSQYFVQHTPGNFSRVVAMINLDMTGVGDAIRISGGEKHPELARTFFEAGKGLGPQILAGELTIPPNSDYGPFMERGIPVLGITSATTRSQGGPMRGHSPRDTPDQINPDIAAAIVRLVLNGSLITANQR